MSRPLFAKALSRLCPLLAASAIAVLAGCTRSAPNSGSQPPSTAAIPPQTSPTAITNQQPPAEPVSEPQSSGKIKITAYINVSSGCQVETVQLLNKLAMDNRDLVDVELVDFGSPEGEQRWRDDGLDCMAILFNGSPAAKFPGKDGKIKTVAFFMPAGLGWEHQDLEDAFAAIRAGKFRILTEEEARAELTPEPVTLNVSVKQTSNAAEVQVNGVPVFVLKASHAGKSPAQRAQEAKAALLEWSSHPVDPSHLSLIPKGDSVLLLAGDTKVIEVTPNDAKKAGQSTAKELGTQWLRNLRSAVVSAARES